MSKPIINELSSQQKLAFPDYLHKWQAIATKTQAINKEKAEAAIKYAYKIMNYGEPEIIFVGSPWGAIKKIIDIENFSTYLGVDLQLKFLKRVVNHLRHLIERQLEESFFYELFNRISYPEYPHHLDCNNNPKSFHFPMGIRNCVETQIVEDIYRLDRNYAQTELDEFSQLAEALVKPSDWSIWGCMLDFCISELDLQHDRAQWQVLQELMENCGFIFQFENVCFVCDRPTKLIFDRQNLLHAEWEYALQFPDGYGVYAYRGGQRPEGKRCQNEQYIEPGTRVKLASTEEYGIVVHCWYSEEIYDFDCYVAFYGTSFPDEKTCCRPYIFRYAAVSLEIIT